MRSAAKQLEFERAAALRDEIQQIRLRVLEQDQSLIVGRGGRTRGARRRARRRSRPEARAPPRPTSADSGPAFEVTSVDGPAGRRGARRRRSTANPAIDENTAADWLPGIRDEHDDDPGWQARWLDRPTWDRTVTPNVRRRTGTRPGRRRR